VWYSTRKDKKQTKTKHTTHQHVHALLFLALQRARHSTGVDLGAVAAASLTTPGGKEK
jgi:hypothetical protein